MGEVKRRRDADVEGVVEEACAEGFLISKCYVSIRYGDAE